MPSQVIVVPGKPIAKGRPRFTKIGNFVKVYSPQAKEEKAVTKEIRSQWRLKPLDCPVVVSMAFLMPITQASKKAVASMLSGATKHTKKSDIDNLIKLYLDCMTGVVYKDDSQVYEVEANKAFGQVPETIIRVIW